METTSGALNGRGSVLTQTKMKKKLKRTKMIKQVCIRGFEDERWSEEKEV